MDEETGETAAEETRDDATGAQGETGGDGTPVSDITDAEATAAEAEGPADGTASEDHPVAEAHAARLRLRAHDRDLPNIAGRIFGTPLLMERGKLDVIMRVLAPRLGVIFAGDAPQDIFVAPARSTKLKVSDEELRLRAGLADDDDDDDGVPYDVTNDGIAIINVSGTLVYKTSWLGAMSGLTSYASVADAVSAAAGDASVKGILLIVGSNGGEVNGCFDASDAIFEARAKKPVYGCAADNAYSGGYALLAAATKVFVSRTSGVGSIGVQCLHCDQSKADKAEGLTYTYIYSGARKVDGNPHEPLSADARAWLQAESDRVRALFAGSVAKYRGLTADKLMATEAALYFAENAIAANLADQIGTPEQALAALRAEVGARAASATAFSVTAAQAPQHSAAPAATNGDVVDLDSVRAIVRGETRQAASEIVSLCMLAGLPDKASEFIKAGVSVASVRESLQTLRAQSGDALITQGHVAPDAVNQDAQAAAAGWENAVKTVCGVLRK